MIVTCNHKTLDLSKPVDADAFLMAMGSYGAAAKCEWAREYDFAERTLSAAIYDRSVKAVRS
jgi:hypothetical protein